jgi:hypothetical protein
MEKQFPDYWKNDTDEGGKNNYEAEFLIAQLNRLGLNIKQDYFKITNLASGRKLADSFKSLKNNDLVLDKNKNYVHFLNLTSNNIPNLNYIIIKSISYNFS